MKRVVLFGAGMAGAALLRLLGGDCEAVCFADNDSSKHGTVIEGLPVVSAKECLSYKPDMICLCAMNPERRHSMAEQLRSLGFEGEFISPESVQTFDPRYGTMRLLARQINELGIAGDIAELGVFRGDFARQINAAFAERTLYLFDSFEGFSASDVAAEKQFGFSRAAVGDFSGTSAEFVLSRLPYPEKARVCKGYFPGSFALCEAESFAFVSLDADLYAPTAAALEIFFDKLTPGGVILVHDAISTQYQGVMSAVREFCDKHHIIYTPVCDLHGSVIIRK